MFTMPTKRIISTLLLLCALTLTATGCYPLTPTQEAVTFFPPSTRTKASCIIRRESGGNPNAVSATGDYGLFQINRAAHAANFYRLYHKQFTTYALHTDYNARYARYLYDVAGWSPWNNGRYPC